MTATQTRHYYRRNPSKLPYLSCFPDHPKIGPIYSRVKVDSAQETPGIGLYKPCINLPFGDG